MRLSKNDLFSLSALFGCLLLFILFINLAGGVIVIPPGQMQNKVKVINIGLSRTGTSSLTTALTQMGLSTYHFCWRLSNYQGEKATLNPYWLEKFDAHTDIPAIPVYKEIFAKYPESKFIYTCRSPDGFATSMQRLIQKHSFFLQGFPWYKRVLKDVYGRNYDQYTHEEWKQVYEKHEAEVLAFFREHPDRLLILDLKDIKEGKGFEKLSEFLGIQAPPNSYPKENELNLSFKQPFNHLLQLIHKLLHCSSKEKELSPHRHS